MTHTLRLSCREIKVEKWNSLPLLNASSKNLSSPISTGRYESGFQQQELNLKTLTHPKSEAPLKYLQSRITPPCNRWRRYSIWFIMKKGLLRGSPEGFFRWGREPKSFSPGLKNTWLKIGRAHLCFPVGLLVHCMDVPHPQRPDPCAIGCIKLYFFRKVTRKVRCWLTVNVVTDTRVYF